MMIFNHRHSQANKFAQLTNKIKLIIETKNVKILLNLLSKEKDNLCAKTVNVKINKLKYLHPKIMVKLCANLN